MELPLSGRVAHYYEPTHVNYALLFKEGRFFLHDAWWHVQLGPGSNQPHQLPDGSEAGEGLSWSPATWPRQPFLLTEPMYER
jgi:hypothetical protein